MSTFTIVLLIVILVLIASDVFFLWKIWKNRSGKKKQFPDERYFELKYNINLLKAISALLIFLLGFLGFTSYNDILNNIEGDFSAKFTKQNIRIDSLSNILSKYEVFVDSLKSEEGQSIENLNDVKKEFGIINKKIAKTQESLKYTTKVFVVNNLVFNTDRDGSKTQKFIFNRMRTAYGESLPKFKKAPFVITQVKGGMGFYVHNITKDYVELRVQQVVRVLSDKVLEKPNHTFEMWIAEPN